MLQRLLIALVHVKAGNTSENLLNEIRQIIYSLYRPKEITKKRNYYLELLRPQTMKLLGGTKSKITKDENGENMRHLGINEVRLVHCNIVNNHYQQNS